MPVYAYTVAPVMSAPVTGLEWDGNETTNTQRVLRYLNPHSNGLTIYDATYIFRVYPKGPKTGTNPHYWTTFFWGNNGNFNWNVSVGTYYGGHPYPFDGINASTGQNWEVSTGFSDIAIGNGANSGQATWDRWYTQVFRAWRESAAITHHEFIYDWDLYNSSNGTSGHIVHIINDATWASSNPPNPSVVIGEAPPNDANDASWGGYIGREQFKGIIRGIGGGTNGTDVDATKPSLAQLANVASEIANPGSVLQPWYLNLNPTPSDVTDKSGGGHHFSFPASLPTLWTG
jgi:hypothetical protein